MNKPASSIYLDYNASTPIDPRVAAVMRTLLDGPFANPSATHAGGRAAREIVEHARAQVAALLGCAPDEVVFTSGGSEANNMALKGAYFALRNRGDHIVTTAIEHPAIVEPARFLERLGGGLKLKSKGGYTAALLVVPIDQELPKIRNEESTWAGRRAGT